MRVWLQLFLCPGFAGAQYVTKSGHQFICQGELVQLFGSTFYPATVGYTSAWHANTFPSYINQIVALEKQAGQNILRPTDYWDSSTPNQTYNDPVLWSNMDYLISTCKSNNLFVEMDISAWEWVLTQEGLNVANATNWYGFIDYVAARYQNEPTIAYWSVLGEASIPQSQAAADNLVNFYATVLARLRSDDTNHLICAGGFNNMEYNTNYNWWTRIFALTNNDIDGFKTYSQDDLNLMPLIISTGLQDDKILVDEEFGMPQNMGDGIWSGLSYNGIYTDRADFFKSVYSGGLPTVAGFLFWDMGEQVLSTGYEVAPDTSPAVWSVIQSYTGANIGNTNTANPISINYQGGGTAMGSLESAGVVPEINWNNANYNYGGISSLVDSTGAACGASASWSANGVYNTGVPDIAGNDRMMRNYLDTGNSTTTIINVGGLPPNSGGWEVYVYCDGNNGETREGNYTVSGAGFMAMSIKSIDVANTDFKGTFIQASNSAGNFVLFPIPSVSGFTISATPVANGATSPRAPVNGVQIIPQPPVILQFQSIGSNVQLSWPQGTLLETTNVSGPWVTNNAASPYMLTPTNPAMFYRIQVR